MKVLNLDEKQKKNLKGFLKEVILERKIDFDWLDLEARYRDLEEVENDSFLGLDYFDFTISFYGNRNEICIFENRLYVNIYKNNNGICYVFSQPTTVESALNDIYDILQKVLENEEEKKEMILNFFLNN
ncbi:hypothetical protein [Streptobacillus canis]|uniref:hypothetical protein n=1 Tax=Streptobacillus canis TaxID=2678686 RepID=UPI0012E0CFD8|nr:hypothetical protein [Streptobacillus canis]